MGLELRRAEIPERRVSAVGVVVGLDVIKKLNPRVPGVDEAAALKHFPL